MGKISKNKKALKHTAYRKHTQAFKDFASTMPLTFIRECKSYRLSINGLVFQRFRRSFSSEAENLTGGKKADFKIFFCYLLPPYERRLSAKNTGAKHKNGYRKKPLGFRC